ncbi:MAG: sugar-binding protein [Rhodocyclales bacterium]|nr:sugar-binding protein [Rhodocyclales bacterium]
MHQLRRTSRLISRVLILAQFAWVTQPLSVLAKEPGELQAEAMAAVRKQAQRDPALARRLGIAAPTEPASTRTTLQDPAQQRLQHIESLVKRLHPEIMVVASRAQRPNTQDASGINPNTDSSRLAAIGPDMRVEIKGEQHPVTPALPKGLQLGSKARSEALGELRQELTAQRQAQAQQLADFAKTRDDLRQRKLSDATLTEVLARHDAAMNTLQARSQQFSQLASAVEQAPDASSQQAAAAALADFFKQYPASAGHTASDPKHLPWGSPSNKVRAPLETEADYRKQSAALGIPTGLPTRLAGGFGRHPAAMLLPGLPVPTNTPTADDLASTEDVQLTPAILAKAAALNKDPVKIYNWVRNNIEFIPSYGSIQGSDLTLKNGRGNAFDTASLLIALLRASGISARYVYGTIQVPIDQAKNWVGGVTDPAAVQSLLGQGGVPNVLLSSGGQITHVRLEHVWVEGWIDYVPSRGAKHVAGDTWVPMDASFKQYQYTAGMNIKQGVPLDASALQAQLTTGATVNTTEGWVQNLNSAALQSTLTSYQAQVKTYIDSQPGATVGDVLGSKKTILTNSAILIGSLPYTTLALAGRFASMPDSLRWKYRTQLLQGSVDYFGDVSGTNLVSLNQSTAKLAGKKITLSFAPASQADTDLINSYLPKPHTDGTPIQPSELPSSLPGYLFNLKAEVRVDGQLVQQSTSSITMGTELLQATAMFNPGKQAWEEGEPNKPIAGEYHAIALDLQGISKGQLDEFKQKLQTTQTKLLMFQSNPSSTAPIQGLTKEDVAGDLLYSGVLGYFDSVDGNDQLSAKSNGNIVSYRQPSYGAFEAVVNTSYWFGIPRNVNFPGVMMDIDRVAMHVEAKDMDKANKLAYMKQVGSMQSAFEHAVPEKLFADSTKSADDPTQPQGVSAVKALALAAAQGQRIYTLTQANVASLDQITIEPEAKAEIADALQNGKEVTVHQNPISQNGWTGSGYIVLDTDTGAGAYKIAGGANGGFLFLAADGAMAIAKLALFAGIVGVITGTALIGVWFIALALLFAAMISILALLFDEQASKDTYFVSEAIIGIFEALPHLFTTYGPLVYLAELIFSLRGAK